MLKDIVDTLSRVWMMVGGDIIQLADGDREEHRHTDKPPTFYRFGVKGGRFLWRDLGAPWLDPGTSTPSLWQIHGTLQHVTGLDLTDDVTVTDVASGELLLYGFNVVRLQPGTTIQDVAEARERFPELFT